MEASGRPVILAVNRKGNATFHLGSGIEKKNAQGVLEKTVNATLEARILLAPLSVRA